jgi:hypothetical protein
LVFLSFLSFFFYVFLSFFYVFLSFMSFFLLCLSFFYVFLSFMSFFLLCISFFYVFLSFMSFFLCLLLCLLFLCNNYMYFICFFCTVLKSIHILQALSHRCILHIRFCKEKFLQYLNELEQRNVSSKLIKHSFRWWLTINTFESIMKRFVWLTQAKNWMTWCMACF